MANSTIVLDAYAVLAWVNNESGAALVRDTLKRARMGECRARICVINLGEVFYIYWRRHGREETQRLWIRLDVLAWSVVPATDSLVFEAAQIKAEYRMSYADAFAVATARRESAPLLTDDPEIRSADHGVRVVWSE